MQMSSLIIEQVRAISGASEGLFRENKNIDKLNKRRGEEGGAFGKK